jgi:hypothetical protein
MAITIKGYGWLSHNRQAFEGGSHDGTYYIRTTPDGGKAVVFRNGQNGTNGTVVRFGAADLTNFTNADSTKHK